MSTSQSPGACGAIVRLARHIFGRKEAPGSSNDTTNYGLTTPQYVSGGPPPPLPPKKAPAPVMQLSRRASYSPDLIRPGSTGAYVRVEFENKKGDRCRMPVSVELSSTHFAQFRYELVRRYSRDKLSCIGVSLFFRRPFSKYKPIRNGADLHKIVKNCHRAEQKVVQIKIVVKEISKYMELDVETRARIMRAFRCRRSEERQVPSTSV